MAILTIIFSVLSKIVNFLFSPIMWIKRSFDTDPGGPSSRKLTIFWFCNLVGYLDYSYVEYILKPGNDAHIVYIILLHVLMILLIFGILRISDILRFFELKYNTPKENENINKTVETTDEIKEDIK